MTTDQRNFLTSCAQQYRTDLFENILPFWMKYGWDRTHGGVYTCVDRDGTLMDTTKSVWFQGRFGYVMAHAAQLPGANPEWLEASKSAIDFIEKHCIDSDGHMFFTVTEDGKPVQKRRYVFSECFAAMAMAEYSAATGNGEYADKAVAMFKNILRMLSTPGFLQPKTYIPGRGHSITMMLINVAQVVRKVSSDPVLDERTNQSIEELSKYEYSGVQVQKFEGERCERCWNYFNEIDLTDHLCPRCHEIVETLKQQMNISKYVIFGIPSTYFNMNEKMLGNERGLTLDEWKNLIHKANGKIVEIKKWFKPKTIWLFVIEKNKAIIKITNYYVTMIIGE